MEREVGDGEIGGRRGWVVVTDGHWSWERAAVVGGHRQRGAFGQMGVAGLAVRDSEGGQQRRSAGSGGQRGP